MTRDSFNTELYDLEERFDALEPELAETLTDPDTGVEGYVVVWNTDISVGGPLERMGKGGTRVTPKTSLDEIKMLARIMALKNAAAGLPLGGSKSGLKADSKAPDFEKTYRRFVSLAAPYLHENGGIFGGFGYDIGARPEMPHWACDELNSLKCFTGKPLDMGGTDYDKEGIAGLGVAVAAKAALEYDQKPIKGSTFSVQGLGAMGAAIIKYFSEYGGALMGIADPRIGGSYIFNTPAPPSLISALSIGDTEQIKNEIEGVDIKEHSKDCQIALYADVDVVFPAAVQDVISTENQMEIKADYVCEGANNPSSEGARTKLFDRGVTVIPDFIANPGGVIAAYVELTSDIPPEENVKTRHNPEKAKARTIKKISENVSRVMDLARTLDIEPVHAARYIALKNIFGE